MYSYKKLSLVVQLMERAKTDKAIIKIAKTEIAIQEIIMYSISSLSGKLKKRGLLDTEQMIELADAFHEVQSVHLHLKDIIENLNLDLSIKEKVSRLRLFLEHRYKDRLIVIREKLGDKCKYVEEEFQKEGITIGKLEEIG